MTTDKINTDVETTTGMCMDCIQSNAHYRVQRHVIIPHNLGDYGSGIPTRGSIKRDDAYCLQWLLIKHLWQLLNTHITARR